MQLSPRATLIGSTAVVTASTFGLAQVHGYGTTLGQFVALFGWYLASLLTSERFAETHHWPLWAFATLLNVVYFLVPASAIWFVACKRWRRVCIAALVVWLAFYLLCLFWLFPATDGP